MCVFFDGIKHTCVGRESLKRYKMMEQYMFTPLHRFKYMEQ